MIRRYAQPLTMLLRFAVGNAVAFFLFSLAGWTERVREPYPTWFHLPVQLCFYVALGLFALSLPLLMRTWYRHNAILLAAISGCTVMVILFLNAAR